MRITYYVIVVSWIDYNNSNRLLSKKLLLQAY